MAAHFPKSGKPYGLLGLPFCRPCNVHHNDIVQVKEIFELPKYLDHPIHAEIIVGINCKHLGGHGFETIAKIKIM